jgi:hypothetical protein
MVKTVREERDGKNSSRRKRLKKEEEKRETVAIFVEQ